MGLDMETSTVEEHDQTTVPDPRLVAVTDAADALKTACSSLPDTPSRHHALAHLDAVTVYAAQAIREETLMPDTAESQD